MQKTFTVANLLEAPLVASAILILLVNLALICVQLGYESPRSPFEAGIDVDAARLASGATIYSNEKNAQATTMYGPVLTVTLSALVRLFGPSPFAPKAIALASSALMVLTVVLALGLTHNRLCCLLGVSLLVGCNSRYMLYFVDGRPDMLSLLFALLGIRPV